MAPALTAELSSPKEKLTSNASPATGTRQASRKLDCGDAVKKPTAATVTATTITTRVTRSKDAQRTISPQVNNNNKRKSNNNNHNCSSSEIQMGLSAAATHTSSDGSAAATSSNSVGGAEHNNNCKEAVMGDLLAARWPNYDKHCLRKTLPELSFSKEQPATAVAPTATTPALAAPMAEAEAQSQSTSAAAAEATPTPLTPTPDTDCLLQLVAQEALPHILSSAAQAVAAAEIPDNLEERLSQLDGSPSVILPPIVDITAATLEASVSLPTTPIRPQQQPEILASPQSAAGRQVGALLTPQSTGSSINFLKDGAAGAVLEDQEFEEVLKALKTLDGGNVNPDTICDFNFFNDFAYNEDETATVAAAAAAIAGSTTTTPVSALGAAVGCNEMDDSLQKAIKPQRPLQECHAELEQQQHLLEHRINFLLRRMRKFQARQMCHHCSDEVGGILEWSARSSHKATPAAPVRSAKLTEQEDTVLSIVSGRPVSGFWEEQTKQPLPASQMSNVLGHIEASARKQQICQTIGGGSASLASSSSWYSSAAQPGKRGRKQQQPMNAIPVVTRADGISTTCPDEIVPNYDTYVTSELTHVSGLLHTEMREVQNAIDSDATESSSGGESADEMVNYNNTQQLSLPISRRAVWRYSKDRAIIALRWSWLCAQVADLDMKIRQHNDVYNDLCRTKGDVLLEPTPAPKNGYKEQQQQPPQQAAEEMDADWLCSRARPLVMSEFRKRKLFQTTNMHTISKKAARPSNIKCGCQWPQVPCTLCTGRPDPTAPRELPETLMPQNRVALLDPGYHPVLSFSNDVCQSIYLEAISRQPDWQYRVMRSQAKVIVKSVFKAEREAIALSAGNGGSGGAAGRRPGETVKRRYVRRKERNNNNRSNNKETTIKNNNNNINNNNSSSIGGSGSGSVNGGNGGGGIVGLVDSGNGTGTATTSSSSTPTTTPLVANMSKRQRQPATSTVTKALPLSDSRHQYQQQQQQQQKQKQKQQQQQLNSTSSLISSNGNGSGSKKPRNSKTSNTQQQKHSINNNNISSLRPSNGHNNNSRFTGDSHWEQRQNSRRNSAENHGQRASDRRSRLIYDIDNIVIPYSMAAQTRVEILPYKDIPTPKWRVVKSDHGKKPQSAIKSNSTQKLSNGCAADVDKEPALPESTKTATAIAAKLNNNNNNTLKDDLIKPAAKINGIKKKKPLPETGKLPEKGEKKPLSNGLPNGEAAKKEQAPEQLQQPEKQPTIVNGKTKKHNKNTSVNNVNKTNAVTSAASPAHASAPAAAAPAPAPAKPESKKAVATAKSPVESASLEPPSKRPKLQITQVKPLTPEEPPKAIDDDEEDISDEAYIVRHNRALLEERKRFEAYLKFPCSSRPRANRRVDSRAESSGANTPDPASPAASHLAGPTADNESIPSPLAQTMLHHPLDDRDLLATAAQRQERRRTTSSKLKDYDRRSATPDIREEPPAFEPLQFPLNAETYQRLLANIYTDPPPTPAFHAPAKRSKSKSVSSNGGDGSSTSTAGSRRSSKAKATSISKLAQQTTTATTPSRLANGNGGKNPQHQQHINGDGKGDAHHLGIESEPEEDEEEEEGEEVELMMEEDDDHHYLAPPEDDEVPAGMGDDANTYNASIEHDALDDDELADDPFMDDDPNDPEWKRSIGVRMRKRV